MEATATLEAPAESTQTPQIPVEPMPGVGSDPQSEDGQTWQRQAKDLMNLHPPEGYDPAKVNPDEDESDDGDEAPAPQAKKGGKPEFIDFPGHRLKTDGMSKKEIELYKGFAKQISGAQGDDQRFDSKLDKLKAEILEKVVAQPKGPLAEDETSYLDDVETDGIEGFVSREDVLSKVKGISNEGTEEAVSEVFEAAMNHASQTAFLMMKQYLEKALGLNPEQIERINSVQQYAEHQEQMKTPPRETISALNIAAGIAGIDLDDDGETARDFQRRLIEEAAEIKASGVDPKNPEHRIALAGFYLKEKFSKSQKAAPGAPVSAKRESPERQANGRFQPLVPLGNGAPSGRSRASGTEGDVNPKRLSEAQQNALKMQFLTG